ncbi:hypothetical protein [Streptomyces sp. NPDC059003]|uniref:hypothetical protein n=1 Tax=Streptomyces sp. NPDC059003 TaxID=3346691 RepID=UPI00368A25CB
MTDDVFELLNTLVPPDEREHFQRFTVAVNNTMRVLDSLALWSTLAFADEDVDDPGRQMRAPNIRWLTAKTQLTEDMVLSSLAALVASGGIVVVRDGVWMAQSPSDDAGAEAARERLWKHLREATQGAGLNPAGAPWLPPLPEVPKDVSGDWLW